MGLSDVKGGATLEVSDILSFCKDLSRSSISGFPGDSRAHACSALLSCKHHHTPAAVPRPALWLFQSLGELTGLHPTSLVAGLGMCLDGAAR